MSCLALLAAVPAAYASFPYVDLGASPWELAATASMLDVQGYRESAAALREKAIAGGLDGAERDAAVEGLRETAEATGDDARLVEIARTLPPGAVTPPLRAHVDLDDARRAGQTFDLASEERALDDVPADSILYPAARFRRASIALDGGKLKTGVHELRDVITRADTVPSEVWALRLDAIKDEALHEIAWVYASIGRYDQMAGFASVAPEPGYAALDAGWVAVFRDHDGRKATKLARKADKLGFFPETALIAVDAELADEDAAGAKRVADDEIARWKALGDAIAAFEAAHPADAWTAWTAGPLDARIDADLRRTWTISGLAEHRRALEDERAKLPTSSPLVALLDAGIADVHDRLGTAVLAGLEHRRLVIGDVVAQLDAVRQGLATSGGAELVRPPRPWSDVGLVPIPR